MCLMGGSVIGEADPRPNSTAFLLISEADVTTTVITAINVIGV